MNGKPSGKITYRQQYTRCGKERCRKCRDGVGHGPYWYAYWSEKGRTVSRYIGVTLPPDIASELTQQESSVLEPHTPIPSTETQHSKTQLRVYLLGQYRLERKHGDTWEMIENRTWHRRRARSLLGCLLSSPGRRLGREQLRDLLWPDLDVDIAANRLNGAVHELRQILEPDLPRPAASRLLRLERDVLEIADSSQIWVDAEAFEQLVKMANTTTDPTEALQLLERASHLYEGNYLLEELYSEWAAPRRDALQRTWTGMLLQLAQLYVERGEHINAIETLDRIRTAEPTNETALQRLMLLLTHLDRRGEALQVYNAHVTLLEREYEGEPLPETTELYDALRQGHIPALPAIKTGQPALANAFSAPQLSPRLPLIEQREEVGSPQPTLHEAVATSILHFTRPSFHLSRHSRSPLIGRSNELNLMRRVMNAVSASEGAHPSFEGKIQESLTYLPLGGVPPMP
ncbi:DUF6788 family protein [Ktedonospora formicarum]|uniref:Bacterial transcriptional activator domain-containing protein n=1 Tax=Ktedonospora formicarum TaxID=2778364 RepID=A0A8J3IBK6_9CHLR|nr:DUF6788 family protein [Ktedonospora formicarum]GHO50280.1 hypothetical protein KSX_84430 [Ktedonospora formicarum]